MESTNPCTKEEQAHRLQWAYGVFAYSDYTPEHSRKGKRSRAMASDAVCAPASSEYCQDGFNVALPNVKRRS